MAIVNWGKVLMCIKELNELNNYPYFNLEKWCEDNNVDYNELVGFLNISNSIISGDSKLIELLGEKKRLTKQLEQVEIYLEQAPLFIN